MHRMIWRLVSARSGLPAASSGAYLLIHRSGTALADAGGEPLRFSSTVSAEDFRLRFTCEPLAYRCTDASGWRVAA